MSADMDRLPDATRLGAVRLQVADLARSVAFYETVLGLATLESTSDRAALGPAGAAEPLLELRARAGARAVPPHGRLGLYHFAVLLPDRASLGRFVRHLGSVGARFGASDHQVSEAVYLSDPDGLGIEVYADRPRTAWRIAGGTISMGSDPLDLADLVAAGGETVWSGAPPGTAIGHVHLHVGNLATAAAFYSDALGFTPTLTGYPGALFVSAGGYHHHLGLNTWAPPVLPQADDARLLEWEVVVPTASDAGAAAERLVAAGYTVDDGTPGWSAGDPWGTVVRVRPATG